LHLLGDTDAESMSAATALINLTALPAIAMIAVENGAVERSMDFLRDGVLPSDLLLMLLANLTNTEGGVNVITQEGKSLEGYFINKLVHMLAFSKPASMFDYAASILTNITRHPVGRRVFLEPKSGLLHLALQSLAQGQSEKRRLGVAAAVRNCCLEETSCTRLLATPTMTSYGDFSAANCRNSISSTSSSEGGLETIRLLLQIVTGSHRAREHSDAIRQCCAESIAALAHHDGGRASLVECDAPRLISIGYAQEQHMETCAALEAAATLFLSHGLVPEEFQPPEGVQRVEILDEEGG
jgi:hypothetical protein